jgi:hypothetical protein
MARRDSEMLERVATDPLAQGETCRSVSSRILARTQEADHYGEIGASRGVRGKQEHKQQNQNRINLDGGIETKVPLAAKLSGAPYRVRCQLPPLAIRETAPAPLLRPRARRITAASSALKTIMIGMRSRTRRALSGARC